MAGEGAIGNMYEAAKGTEEKRFEIRDQVASKGPPLRHEDTVDGSFMSRAIYGRAVDEVDPFVFEDTFCVLSRKFGKDYVFRFSSSRSLFLFGPLNPFRRFCVFLITQQIFDLIIILTIVANCIALAFDNNRLYKVYKPGTNETVYRYITKEFDLPGPLEMSFLGVYTMEMVFKITAKGFVLNKFSYLRNRWNILDFIVVICGFLTEVLVRTLQEEEDEYDYETNDKPKAFDLDFLRVIRVLRVVKTISILPGLKMMINALLNAMVQLVEVMALTFFCLCIFGLFAVEIFMGKFHNTCVRIKGSESEGGEPIDDNAPDRDYLWKEWVTNPNNWAMRDFPDYEPVPCSNHSTGGRECETDYICLPGLADNPDHGWTSFDTFPIALLSAFQLLTLDYWERLYDLVMSTTGPVCIPFCVMVIFLGSFYLLNLMLAVVAMSYEAEARSWQKKALTKHQRLALHRTDSQFSFADPRNLNVNIMTQFSRRTPSEREFIARQLRNNVVRGATGNEHPHEEITDVVIEIVGQELYNIKPPKHPQSQGPNELVVNQDPPPNADQDITEGDTENMVALWTKPGRTDLTQADDIEDEARDEKDIVSRLVVPETGPDIDSTQLAATPSGNLVFKMSELEDGSNSDEDRNDDDDEDEQEAPTENMSDNLSALTLDMAEDHWEHASLSSASSVSNREMPEKRKRCGRIFNACKMPTRHLLVYVNHWSFDFFITGCIVVNTLILACEHADQPEYLDEIVRVSTHFFTAVFAFECIFKIYVLQIDYFNSPWNVFDLTIAVFSTLDTTVEVESIGGISNAIRGFRLLRIFKLAQSWLTMKILLNIIFSTFGALGNLTLVLAIVIYIFAILGMQVVGKQYTPEHFGVVDKDDEEFPRWHFENFWYSFMMVFRVLCGEWIEPLWECLEAMQGYDKSEEWKCFVIFLPILVVGNFIILNLFLALLLNSFSSEELKSQRERERQAHGKIANLKRAVKLMVVKGHKINVDYNKSRRQAVVTDKTAAEVAGPKAKFKAAGIKVIANNRREAAERAILRYEAHKKKNQAGGSKMSVFINFKNPTPVPIMVRRQEMDESAAMDINSVATMIYKKGELKPCLPKPCMEWRCGSCRSLARRRWQKWDKAREFCNWLTTRPAFEWGILVLIMASSITLCFEDIYYEEDLELKFNLFVLNSIFTCIFILEMLTKWMSLGLYDYFKNFWNLVDVFVVIIGVMSFVFDYETHSYSRRENKLETGGIGAFKSFRALRAVRPLRAISRWQGMRVVVNALVYAIPSIFNVLLVCLLFWLVFAIMAVQFFKGKFYKCVEDDGYEVDSHEVEDMEECCAIENYSWINVSPNFDNVFMAYLSLFQIATFEGWMELMRSAVDSNPSSYDTQPVRDQSMTYYLFFVIFIICGAFFTLNLFIGVIIDNFNVLKKKYEGNLLEVLLTPSQRRYYTAMRKIGRKKPRKLITRPNRKLLALFYDIAMSRRFEIAIFIVIFLNMLVMAFQYYNQLPIYKNLLAAFNSFFTTIYLLEAVLKIIGLRHYYFTVPFNCFDFALVVLSIVDFFVPDDTANLPFPPTLLRVFRVFRIGRVLRLIKAAKGIRKLLFALVVSIPALFNIGALLALITFIYAILGMEFFKYARFHDAVNEVFNFQTFGRSCLMLLRLMTAAGWDEVLTALMPDPATKCGNYSKFEEPCSEESCISQWQPIAYLSSYIFISFLIVINMYIAIILENFVEANKDEEVGIVEDDMEMFYIRWAKFDPTASQFINFDQLSDFLGSLEPPLDVPKPNLVAIVSFNLPIARGNKIHCLDILHALVAHTLGSVDDSEEFRQVQLQMDQKFRKLFPSRNLLEVVSTTRVWKIQHNAAMIIQKAWRAYRKSLSPPPEKMSSVLTIGSRSSAVNHHHMVNRLQKGIRHQSELGRRRMSSFANALPFLRRASSIVPRTPASDTSGIQQKTMAPSLSPSRGQRQPGRRLSNV